jgi:hypothetical protein
MTNYMSKYAALVKNDTVQPYEKQEINWKNCTTLLVYLIAFISAMSNLHPHNKFLYLILFSHLFYDYSLTGFSVRTVYTLPIPIYAACSVPCFDNAYPTVPDELHKLFLHAHISHRGWRAGLLLAAVQNHSLTPWTSSYSCHK